MPAESSTGCEIFRELGCLVWWGWSSQPSEGYPTRGITIDCHQDISEKRFIWSKAAGSPWTAMTVSDSDDRDGVAGVPHPRSPRSDFRLEPYSNPLAAAECAQIAPNLSQPYYCKRYSRGSEH